jgi:geranylgeranyl pyrophosphate synthase
VTTQPASETLDAVRAFAVRFSRTLDQRVSLDARTPETLAEAMRYSLLAPGKRLRPFLVYKCGELCGADEDACFAPAAAIEMIHAFSLIHDDLPAMDDDDLRRGRPTNHKVFGEAVAILAGDALVTLAFETLATKTLDREHVAPLVAALARAAGGEGMIGGQTLDIEGQRTEINNRTPLTLDAIRRIHSTKTGALFDCACRLGGIVAGADDEILERLAAFGLNLGLAFQITDDLLDVTASADDLGKKSGKDAEKGKQTYPASVGIDRSRVLAQEAVAAAIEAIRGVGGDTTGLEALAEFAYRRER